MRIKAVVSEQEQMGVLLTCTEKVTLALNHCTVLESLHRTDDTPGHLLLNLETALVKLYVILLQLIIVAHDLCSQSMTVRALKATFDPSKLDDLVEACSQREAQVKREADLCDKVRKRQVDQAVLAWLENLFKPVVRVDENVKAVLQRLELEEKYALLEWMCPTLYGFHHDSVVDARTEGTCEWVLEKPEFQQWRYSSSSTILWLHGTGTNHKIYPV